MSMPPIDRLAFRVSDSSDHIGGGHCVALPGASLDDERVSLVDQYFRALTLLVDAAQESGDVVALNRPILFTAHHLCEVALKAAILSTGATAKKDHHLSTLWAAAIAAGCFARMSQHEVEWCTQFASSLGAISGDGTPGKYVDGIVGGATVYAVWCCLNIAAIYAASMQFASFCVAEVTGGAISDDGVVGEAGSGTIVRRQGPVPHPNRVARPQGLSLRQSANSAIALGAVLDGETAAKRSAKRGVCRE